MYTKGSKSYELREGSRAQVMHGTAHQTTGGLTMRDLKYNKFGRIVSRVKSAQGDVLKKRLTDAGFALYKKKARK